MQDRVPVPFDPDSLKGTPREAWARAAHRAQEQAQDPTLPEADIAKRWSALPTAKKAEFFFMAHAVEVAMACPGSTQQQPKTLDAVLSFWGGYTGHLLTLYLPVGPLAGCVLAGLGSFAGVYALPLFDKAGEALCGAEDRLRTWARSRRA